MQEYTDEQKLAFYREQGITPESMIHSDYDVETQEDVDRPFTEEEWEDVILNFYPHPCEYQADLSYRGKRREEYPLEEDQLNALWSGLRAVRAAGIDIGDTASDMLNTFDKIKQKYPKPDILN